MEAKITSTQTSTRQSIDGYSRSKDKPAGEVAVLKSRIASLEDEVSEYKRRLDELRKAKNSLVIRKETVFEQVGLPFTRDAGTNRRVSELESKVDELKREHAEELERLRANRDVNSIQNELEGKLKELRAEVDKWKRNADVWRIQNDTTQRQLNDLQAQAATSKSNELDTRPKTARLRSATANKSREDDHRSVPAFSESEVQQLQDLIFALEMQNADLREQNDQLVMALSEREAHRSDANERIRSETETRQNWQLEYQRWMRETEQKLTQLQQTNDILTGRLRQYEEAERRAADIAKKEKPQK